jgi:hypothetical protein
VRKQWIIFSVSLCMWNFNTCKTKPSTKVSAWLFLGRERVQWLIWERSQDCEKLVIFYYLLLFYDNVLIFTVSRLLRKCIQKLFFRTRNLSEIIVSKQHEYMSKKRDN